MRILYTVPSWPRSHSANGITSYVSALLPELQRLGLDVEVLAGTVSPAFPAVPWVNAVTGAKPGIIDRLLWRTAPATALYRSLSLSLLNEVDRIVADRHLDVIETDDAFAAALPLVRRRSIPVVVRLHGPWFLVGNGEDQARIAREGQLLRACAAITAPSQFVLERTLARYKLGSSVPAYTIPNPVPRVEPALVWRPDRVDPMQILFVGRLDELKGADVCLEGFMMARRQEPGLKLRMIGPEGSVGTGAGRQLFNRFARAKLSAADYAAIAFEGMREQDYVSKARAVSGCTLVCSRFENFPNVVLESISQGCPTIASKVGGIPEIIRNGENGLLFEPRSPNVLAEAILKLVRDQTLAARLGAQARRDAVANFDPGRIAAKMAAVYESVLARSPQVTAP
jgi:glycosyltransferase involved in cell wall biosynthesis